jgi:hypothetical protein
LDIGDTCHFTKKGFFVFGTLHLFLSQQYLFSQIGNSLRPNALY